MSKFQSRFLDEGISQTNLYSVREILKLRDFTQSWISENFVKQGVDFPLTNQLSKYHRWAKEKNVQHGKLFSAPFRFTNPPSSIQAILLNKKVYDIFKTLKLKNPNLIDEGMGWLGYRIIRPGMNDGYPLSAKNWGASKGAYSFWIPLFGFGSKYSLHYVSSSHKKDFKSFLPAEGKFTKNELRLDPSENVDVVSEYVRPGNALFYHPRTLHTEDVKNGRKTRINLEFRFQFNE